MIMRVPALSKHTIRFTVVSIFILATVITATIAISLQYYFSRTMATESASQLFSLTSKKTQEHLLVIDKKAENVTQMLAKFGDLLNGHELSDSAIPIFSSMLDSSDVFYAVYIGYGNGDLSEVINLDASPVIRQQIKASYKDRWVVIDIKDTGTGRTRTIKYLDEVFNVRVIREEPSDYLATVRPWYKNAQLDTVYKTSPYMFQNLQAPGQTYSAKIPNTDAVLAIDIALSSLDEYLMEQGLGQEGEIDKEIYLFQKSGEIISSSQKDIEGSLPTPAPNLPLSSKQRQLIESTPTLNVSNETDWGPIDFSISGHPEGYSIDVLTLISEMTGLSFTYTNGHTWSELVDGFDNHNIDMLQPAFNSEINHQRGVLSTPFLTLPFAIITQPKHAKIGRIEQLQGKELAIVQGWSITKTIKEHFPTINIIELPSSRDVLEAVSQGEVYSGLDNEVILRYTQQQYFIGDIQYHSTPSFSPADIDSGLHFILKDEQNELMSIINLAIDNITQEQRDELNKKWLTVTTENGQVESPEGVIPYVELLDLAEQEEFYGKLLPVQIDGIDQFVFLTPVNSNKSDFLAIVVPSETIFSSSLEKVHISIVITSICLLFIFPISWFFSGPIVKPIRLLAIENEKIKHRQYEDVSRINSNIVEIDELAESMVEMSDAIKHHEKTQQNLMDSFIKLIAQTIDDKSAYTGGHCNRVPELGLMLASAAEQSSSEAFNDFSFKNADEYREFQIAAWLHDCGKIITPEHIVDKGSKLEAIYNRIHEVRMRFEVLWRDTEIEFYQALIEQPDKKAELQQQLSEQQSQLTLDYTFVANANVGGEFMAQEKIERLQQIGQRTWLRHFDDTLGLSPVEELHLSQFTNQSKADGSVELPVTEQVLTDKPEHKVVRGVKKEFDEKLGIKMQPPEHQANLGEIYNLSVARGTLTAEDRYIINEHIVGTIKMLEQLPFPPELANVPKFASTHHETLIGTGYPRQLDATDLTIPERILVIADIFEALTAADRPYKKVKPLSVAINILHKFALDEHIDIDLFELFLTSETYLVYAKKFMKPEQIDKVDITKFLRG
ncbi:HD domain-containing phosphohydrolase [Aliivibrio kagoshimensis]|uniref:HD domain-containing phosphohydrolase n=1 Tax=Aliivibrio kagoshimensis TaxID=2910230 RepID=UPI003D0D9FCB